MTKGFWSACVRLISGFIPDTSCLCQTNQRTWRQMCIGELPRFDICHHHLMSLTYNATEYCHAFCPKLLIVLLRRRSLGDSEGLLSPRHSTFFTIKMGRPRCARQSQINRHLPSLRRAFWGPQSEVISTVRVMPLAQTMTYISDWLVEGRLFSYSSSCSSVF